MGCQSAQLIHTLSYRNSSGLKCRDRSNPVRGRLNNLLSDDVLCPSVIPKEECGCPTTRVVRIAMGLTGQEIARRVRASLHSPHRSGCSRGSRCKRLHMLKRAMATVSAEARAGIASNAGIPAQDAPFARPGMPTQSRSNESAAGGCHVETVHHERSLCSRSNCSSHSSELWNSVRWRRWN